MKAAVHVMDEGGTKLHHQSAREEPKSATRLGLKVHGHAS